MAPRGLRLRPKKQASITMQKTFRGHKPGPRPIPAVGAKMATESSAVARTMDYGPRL